MQNGSHVVAIAICLLQVVLDRRPNGRPQTEAGTKMEAHRSRHYRFCSPELNRPHLADWPWRKILADAGLLLAFVLTSSWLMHR
jgi:hypothetical protein